MNDMRKLIESIEEAYDEEVEGAAPRYPEEALRELVSDLQKLERDTARIFNELRQSKNRKDFAALVLNEFSMTLTEISDLVEKYEDF